MVSSSKPAISPGATRTHASSSERSPDAHGRKPRTGAAGGAEPDGAPVAGAAGAIHGTAPEKSGSYRLRKRRSSSVQPTTTGRFSPLPSTALTRWNHCKRRNTRNVLKI